MGDVGTWMVDSLYQQLMVDDQWAVRRERGFTWWGYRLAQHIEVEPPVHDRGLDLCVLRIWTDVARNVSGSDTAAVLAQVNNQATLNALVWDPSVGTITECCSVTVHQDNAAWMSKVLATAAVLQNTAAHSRAHPLARACDGQPAETQHPRSGPRPDMDDMLNVPSEVIAPKGQEPSHFVGTPCTEIEPFLVAHAGQTQWFGSADETGATVEVPFTGARPMMFQDRDSADTRLETALVRVFTDTPHPEAGNGALVITQLPLAPGTDRSNLLANELNRAEAAGGLNNPPLLGAWSPDMFSDNGNGVAFCSFIPNLLAMPMILNNWVLYQATRATWACEFLGLEGPVTLEMPKSRRQQ
ncbi:hypothetical protein LT337_09850 [Mycolicibacterium fortuitum]|nr:hypothetical protein LT337_09850 [Mycolicibacterium fortuitum]